MITETTPVAPEPILDALIAEAVRLRDEAQRIEQEGRRAKIADERRNACTTCETWLATDLPAAVASELGFEVKYIATGDYRTGACAQGKLPDINIAIRPSNSTHPYKGEHLWHITVDSISTGNRRTGDNVTPQGLFTSLLLLIAEVREMDQHTAAREREEKAAREAYARAEAEDEAIREAEHSELTACIETERTKVRASIWAWPEDTELTYWLCEWQKGASAEDFDYDDGYMLNDFSVAGRLHLVPEIAKVARIIHILPEVHRPTWTLQKALRVTDLPGRLIEHVELTIQGAEWYCAKLRRYEHGHLREEIGIQPVAWIRDMLAAGTSEALRHTVITIPSKETPAN